MYRLLLLLLAFIIAGCSHGSLKKDSDQIIIEDLDVLVSQPLQLITMEQLQNDE